MRGSLRVSGGGIQLDCVSAGYGERRVLDGLSAEFPSGALTMLLGPNGSGKSTLLRLLGGALPFSGNAVLAGRSLRRLSPGQRGKLVGMVSQSPSLTFPFTVEEVVRKCTAMPASKFGLHNRGTLAPRKIADITVFDWETIIDTATFEAPHSYSKGIPQRILAFRELLSNYPENRRSATLIQIASPSRESVDAYSDIRRQLERLCGALNGDFGDLDWMPVRYIHRMVSRRRLPGLYRAASVGVITASTSHRARTASPSPGVVPAGTRRIGQPRAA